MKKMKDSGYGSWDHAPISPKSGVRYYKPSESTKKQKRDLEVRLRVFTGFTILWFLVTTYVLYDPQLSIIGKLFSAIDTWRIKNISN